MSRAPIRFAILAALGGALAFSSPALTQESPRTSASGGASARALAADPAGASAASPALSPAADATEIALDEDGNPILGVVPPLHGAPHALSAFHRSLRRTAMGEGQTRILVYGASHVAADFATGRLRAHLQERFGDAGHGFVLPAHPWRYYRHLGVDIESNWRHWDTRRVRSGTRDVDRLGLAGVAITTTRRTTASVSTGTHAASRFELWYEGQPEGGSLDVFIDGERMRRISTRAAEVSTAYALFTVDDGPHTFQIRTRGDGPVTIYGLTAEREVPGVIVDTLGINGARAASHLLWDEALWQEQALRRAPDLVVLAYGTNESGDDDQPIERYEEQLREVVARVRGTLPNASCLLVGPSDRPMREDGAFVDRPRTALIVATQRRVASETGCAFFDMVEFGGGPLHMVEWAGADPAWAQPDHVHYTLRGYQRLGDVLTEELLAGIEASAPLASR